jgi:hypothetical protein
MAKFTAETAGEFGRRGGSAKQAARRLTPAELATLEAMDTPDAVRRNLERIQVWSCAGRMAAGNAGAAVRACAEALRAIELGTELGQLAALRIRLDGLDAAGKARPRGVA